MTTSETPVNVWEFSDQAPEWVDDISALWSWGLNYSGSHPANPWPLFLDIIGYSEEHYGERISGFIATPDQMKRSGYRFAATSLGWVECDKLAKALTQYSDRPSECEEWITTLLTLELGAD